MPRPTLHLANVYTLLIKFQSTLVVGSTWRSSIDIWAPSGPPAPNDGVVTSWVAFAQRNLVPTAEIIEAELRAWQFGPQPYGTGIPIWQETLALVGTKAAAYGGVGANAVGKEVALFVRKTNTGPKEGKMFIRGFLDSGDIAALTGGPWQFLTPGPPNVTDAKFQTNLTAAGVPGFIGGPGPAYVVVHFSYKQYQVDPTRLPFFSLISTIHLVAPTVNKPTRKSRR
jgi:hypothetical protein